LAAGLAAAVRFAGDFFAGFPLAAGFTFAAGFDEAVRLVACA
jgi:hypothetical protein